MNHDLLRVAVVGHTNTGKTSLLRTLTRDVSFGEVSDRPAVTRDVAGTVLTIDGASAIELFDTPGLEDSINLLEHLESLKVSRDVAGIEVIETLLGSPDARTRFSQEAKALRQVIESHVALYVIDARDRVLGKHRDELSILNMCARPIVPVLNFIARSDARTSEWREHLSRLGLHAVAEFDTVVVNEESEERLFEKMRSLLDRHGNLLTRLIDDRKNQREQLIAASARLIAELLVDVAAHRIAAPADDPAAMKQAMERLKDDIREREQRCVTQLLELHRFHTDDCDPSELPIEDGRWGLDLFNPEAMKQFGVHAGSAAAAGAMAGLAIDLAVGGISLGAAAATGAAIGAALSTGKSHGRRILDRLRGKTELRCDDATLLLLAHRQIVLVRALLARGHASQEKLQLHASTDSRAKQAVSPQLPSPIKRARTRPDWSRIPTTSSDAGKPTAAFTFPMDVSRDETVTVLAAHIRPPLHESATAPIRLG